MHSGDQGIWAWEPRGRRGAGAAGVVAASRWCGDARERRRPRGGGRSRGHPGPITGMHDGSPRVGAVRAALVRPAYASLIVCLREVRAGTPTGWTRPTRASLRMRHRSVPATGRAEGGVRRGTSVAAPTVARMGGRAGARAPGPNGPVHGAPWSAAAPTPTPAALTVGGEFAVNPTVDRSRDTVDRGLSRARHAPWRCTRATHSRGSRHCRGCRPQ